MGYFPQVVTLSLLAFACVSGSSLEQEPFLQATIPVSKITTGIEALKFLKIHCNVPVPRTRFIRDAIYEVTDLPEPLMGLIAEFAGNRPYSPNVYLGVERALEEVEKVWHEMGENVINSVKNHGSFTCNPLQANTSCSIFVHNAELVRSELYDLQTLLKWDFKVQDPKSAYRFLSTIRSCNLHYIRNFMKKDAKWEKLFDEINKEDGADLLEASNQLKSLLSKGLKGQLDAERIRALTQKLNAETDKIAASANRHRKDAQELKTTLFERGFLTTPLMMNHLRRRLYRFILDIPCPKRL